MWAPNIQALAAVCRVYAVDQVGEYGKSGCSRRPQSFDDLTEWLDGLLDGLHPVAVNLAGVSYGGALAARYAARFPSRVARLVLLAPAATVLRPSAAFWARLFLAAVFWRRGMPSFVRWMFADMTRRDPRWVDAVIEDLLLNFESLVRRRPVIPSLWSDAEWGALQVPTLFLTGEHDVQYSAVKALRRLKRVAPHILAEIVPDAGHDFTVAHAAAVNRRILDFLQLPPSPS
jgi:pimeloyl-ACP methyl ester carboxylesterase